MVKVWRGRRGSGCKVTPWFYVWRIAAGDEIVAQCADERHVYMGLVASIRLRYKKPRSQEDVIDYHRTRPEISEGGKSIRVLG